MKNGEIAKTLIETMSAFNDNLHEEFVKNAGNFHLPNERALMMALSELLKKFKAPTRAIDKMTLIHMRLGDSWLDTRDNMYKAIKFAELGASKPVLERLSSLLAKRGHLHDLQRIRGDILKSPPTKKEVFLILDDYIHGAWQCDEYELELLVFGKENLSSKDFQKFRILLDKRRRDWKNRLD